MTMTATKPKPILFPCPMVRAILDGRKTQTRLAVKRVKMHADHGQPLWDKAWVDGSGGCQYLKVQYGTEGSHPSGGTVQRHYCPYGQPGGVLWVRESWAAEEDAAHPDGSALYRYAADFDGKDVGLRWKPSIHMPYAACRLWLEVVGVRVQRLHDIGKDGRKAHDVLAEGIEPHLIAQNAEWFHPDDCPALAYAALWESINGKGSWDANPWVWAITFKRTVKP